MSKLPIRFLLLIIWFVSLDGEVQQDRPKIKTVDGDLIIEPAFDRNIFLSPNGPNSNIFVGGVNVLLLSLNASASHGGQYQPSNVDLDRYLNGPDGILRRLERLENRRDAQPNEMLLNVSVLWRRVNRLTNRVTNLQSLISSLLQDECSSRPCMHGGTCLNLARGYHCLCPSNWEGDTCEQDVNECVIYRGTDLGCQNGANCRNTPGAYECDCATGWNGIHCTRRNKTCTGGDFEMCGHGICVPSNSGEGIKCICNQGWTTNEIGGACLTDVNECESSQGPRCSVNPKVQCINLPGSFRCGQCPSGYVGDGYVCSDVDECLTLPNGGCSTSPMVACHNIIGSRICGACPPGYQGDGITCTWRGSCNINRGGCHPSAECIDSEGLGGQLAQCICPSGMEGDGVGLNGCYISTENITRGCDTNPCGMHGQCHPLRSGYTCICYRGYGGAHCDITRDSCSNKPCLHGGSCRQDESSSRGFRCECTAQYTGDLCQVAVKTCGGLLVAEEGSIVYPLTNTTYNHNARCAWVIQTDRDKVINVTFNKFNLEQNPDCLYDFLQIHDGRSSASQIIGRFCGNELPKGGNIISNHNNLYFWFRSDQTVAKDGFALHWNTIDPICGGAIDASVHGHISSPGSPGKYPPNRDCYWHLTTKLGKRIQLHFFGLDIESHPNCSYDFLAIYDGEHTTDPLISKYCNSTQPAPVTSSGSDLLIHFHSDAYNSGYGFQIAFAVAEGVPGCGGLFTTDKGDILSPSYDGKYLNNLICEYKIKTSPDTKIKLNFKSFNLEPSFRCRYDYLKVYDGPSEDSQLAGRFCGSAYPKSYISSTNQVYLKFKSDHSMSAEGFRISYETVCQQTLIGDSGVLKSPGYPLGYPKNQVCEYLITTTPGKAIQLAFQDFNLEDNSYYNCRYDNVEIRDGLNSNATFLGKYCGRRERIPPTITSTHNYMYIRFSSDMSISGTGFYANYTTIDVQCGGIYRDTTGMINYPSVGTYSDDQKCLWMLIAPEGMIIKLTWNRFDIESMPMCRSDFVELVEVDDNDEQNSLGVYCGNTMPPAITTTTNRMKIKFESDSTIRANGFSLSYSFLDEKSHCGGTYTKSHGFIYSPGWPKRYERNRDCIWTITVQAGRQIKLNLTEFDLERPINDKCDFGDYLEIRNGASETSPLIAKLCGSVRSRRIISLSNTLFLRFHSDAYLSGKGFKIEWDSTITGCGGTLTSPSGTISSPNYPLNYNENSECFYRIVTSAGSRISIVFTELDLERTLNCRDDYVEIFDGRDENSARLGKHCLMSPSLRNIESSTNFMFIKFRSDFYIGGKGFLLQYNTICRNNVTGLHGIIESPGYPGTYPIPLNCLWTITVPKGNMINVTFTFFDVPYYRTRSRRPTNRTKRDTYVRNWHYQETCEKDYLQMKDSVDADYKKKICGKTPEKFCTRGNSLQIKFITSGYLIAHRGFRLEWARFGCGGHIQKRFGTVKLDDVTSSQELECEWIIETPQGTSVTFTALSHYMTDSKNCTVDAIEIYNGQTTDYPLLTKICHHSSNGITSVSSTSNFMLVRFVKQSTLKDVHFMANFDSSASGCGGRIETLSGVIHSKNYPQNYDNNMNCLWTLVVPRNHRIELNFQEFDLYSTVDDDCDDSVSIYDGEYVLNHNYTTRLCPITRPPRITSKSSILGVQFLSDNSGTAKGFKANYTIICGATISARYDGILANDKWHSNHILDNCTWTIRAPDLDKKISLTITHLSIPKDTNNTVTNRKCPSSFLKVYEGDDVDGPLVDEYCGRKVPPMIVSRGSALTVVFGAYDGVAHGQFSIHYSPLTSACGGTLTSEEGTIVSPNYPLSYPVGVSCEWILSTSPGNRVYITFEQFDLEWSENCNEDYLEVREENGSGNLLGVYCGHDIPTNTTTGARLYIKFRSDDKSPGRGFVLHYGFLHGNEISGEKGEITSPLYPFNYEGSGDYTWRISTEAYKLISMIIDRLEIPTHSTTCYNSLVVYDGYDEDAPRLEEFCGLLNEEKELKTTSNIAFVKLKLDESNSGSLFHIRWANTESYTEVTEDKPNCGFNETKVLKPGEKITIKSDNYPNKYNNEMLCEWIFTTTPGSRVYLHFNRLDLEETPMCFADYVSVFSSNSPSQWTPIQENICLSEQVKADMNSTKYMKILFKTDFSITKDGFEAEVSSICGGFMDGLSGTIEPRYEEISGKFIYKCEWTIKVRPGRVILLNFDHFNITNADKECSVYVTIRNGDSVEAPMLSTGKYCGYENENKANIESSTNVVFVTFKSTFMRNRNSFVNFRLRYEEKGLECGLTSKLDSDHSWETINSPNYPSVPIPYSECVWVFTGPPGEILKVDFIDRFDLAITSDCTSEYVEVRDGSTDLSPLKGRYCRDKPGTIKSSNNIIYIKYYTQGAEPRNGFKANVTIDLCGGTIVGSKGEVTAPGYPHMRILPYGAVCEWRIIGSLRQILFIKPQEIDLPESQTLCGTKITVEETEAVNNTITILKTYCSEDNVNFDNSPIETSSEEVVIKLHIGRPPEWTPLTTVKGFRFSFNSSRPMCGGTLTTPEGILSTPGYPRETTQRYCQWRITVPDKTRRVRLELLDANTEKHRIGMFNDLHFQTVVQTLPSTGVSDKTIFESSGNTLAIYLWMDSLTNRHRFKARFSSEESALCGGALTGLRGELRSPTLDRSYTCEWDYKLDASTNTSIFNTLYITAKVNSSGHQTHCKFTEPKLQLNSFAFGSLLYFSQSICGNTELSFRIPGTTLNLHATKSKDSYLDFHVTWKLQPCGGMIRAGPNEINILKLPEGYNDTLDCAWLLVVPTETKVQMKLDGSFKLDCTNEFVKISQGSAITGAIDNYCKDNMQTAPLTTSFRNFIVQYHSNVKDSTDVKLMVKTVTDQCGGVLTEYQNVFESPNYPKQYKPNIECSWEIRSNLGSRISLNFIDRFMIEDKPNCTKDAVIIYDWKDNKYIEIGKVCGRVPPPPFNSTYNRMKVVLRTDADVETDGFRAQWIPICGGKYQATNQQQLIYSLGYPDAYLPGVDCKYEITGGDQKVVVQFLQFELEGTYPSCEFDNVTIEASNIYSSYYLATYCGTELPARINEYTDISITLKTDRYVQRKGFMLVYQLYECGGKIKSPTVISSNSMSDRYSANENCTWSIEAPSNKLVVVKFQNIDTESSEQCSIDFVAVFDGKLIDDNKRLALMCGRVNSPSVFRSTGSTMVVQFVSDSSFDGKGFKANIYFTYSSSVGCGGSVDLTHLTQGSTHILKSPLIGTSVVYENFLDCKWDIKAPDGFVINIKFKNFHIAPCAGVNQTAVGFSKCDCDYVEIVDGLNPLDLVMGTFCGHNVPQDMISSQNVMSVSLHTDGEEVSGGFEAELSLKTYICGKTYYVVSHNIQTVKSPTESTGIPRNLHCIYHFSNEEPEPVHLRIKKIDLQPGSPEPNQCNRDKLVIRSVPKIRNSSAVGADFIFNSLGDYFSSESYYNYENEMIRPDLFEYCGTKNELDLYLYGSITINLQTSPEDDGTSHKGVELDVVYSGYCGRNYTEPQGRISSMQAYQHAELQGDCYKLITAPENYTISIYFLKISNHYYDDEVHLDIFDGNKTSATKLTTLTAFYNEDAAVFSSGRYLLLYNKLIGGRYLNYDLNYVTSQEGRGCGGKLHNLVGKVTSPLYPNVYRRRGRCSWELETPSNTKLHLRWTVFDLGRSCDQNYVELVDRAGNTISSYCSSTPADYTSVDNYVKIVFSTTMNNAGTGWVAEFIAVPKL